MPDVRILDIRDAVGFARIPPCADPGFDHRSCDYWEDPDRGSKAARLWWWDPAAAPARAMPNTAIANPFAPAASGPAFNPFATAGKRAVANPFGDDADDEDGTPVNPFAPRREPRPGVGADQPRKLQLLGRGLAVFGTYAKVLEIDGRPAGYVQFGPLSAYPRAQRLRELYRQLPSAPLPAVITCIALAPAARGAGHASAFVASVLDDLRGRGFSAVEAYPERGARTDATSAATPEFWVGCGFTIVVDDERFPVLRLML